MAFDGGNALGLTSIAIFISFIFTCIALSHADSASVYEACGHSLRNLVIVHFFSPFIFLLVFLLHLFMCCLPDTRELHLAFFLVEIFLYSLGLTLVGAFTIVESRVAAQNPKCISALSSKEGSIDSVSANTGSPLLIYMGLVNGSLFVIPFSILIIAVLIFAIFWAIKGEYPAFVDKIFKEIQKH